MRAERYKLIHKGEIIYTSNSMKYLRKKVNEERFFFGQFDYDTYYICSGNKVLYFNQYKYLSFDKPVEYEWSCLQTQMKISSCLNS